MKKVLSLISISLILGVLSSCTTKNNEQGNRESAIISIKNNADFDLYGIEMSIKENIIGSLNSEKSSLQKDAIVRFYLYKSEDYLLSDQVTFTISLIGKAGTLIPLEMTTLELTEKQEYAFEIKGTSINEGSLKELE